VILKNIPYNEEMEKQYQSFKEFYPFYLGEHSKPTTKLLHFLGTLCVLGTIVFAIEKTPLYLLLAPLFGYGFAWISHFFIEKNRPATFTYPLYSFMGDWVMFAEICMGKHKIL